jgi:hypothetical protein
VFEADYGIAGHDVVYRYDLGSSHTGCHHQGYFYPPSRMNIPLSLELEVFYEILVSSNAVDVGAGGFETNVTGFFDGCLDPTGRSLRPKAFRF